MKGLLKYFTLFTLITLLSTCKKYDEGGLINLRMKHLFGGNYNGAKKDWKLKRYEVNGIDSTNFIQGGNLFLNSSQSFVSFQIIDKKNHNYYAETLVYKFDLGVGKKEIDLGTLLHSQNNDTSQCFQILNQQLCQRNIFNPEKNKITVWDIIRLKKDELVVSIKQTNSYKIILEY